MRAQVLSDIDILIDDQCNNCTILINANSEDRSRHCIRECNVGKQLQNLGDKLLEISNSKAQEIFKKGKDMTIDDIRYLRDKGYSREKIGQKAGIQQNHIAKFFNDVTSKDRVSEQGRRKTYGSGTRARVGELMKKGMSKIEVATELEISVATVTAYDYWNRREQGQVNWNTNSKYPKWVHENLSKNGISFPTFYHRITKQNLSYEEASSRPIKNRRNNK